MGAMKTDVTIRKHRTPAQRQEILEAYRQSGLTQKEFARQAAISVSTLQSWRRKAPAATAAPRAAFVAVPNLLAASPPAAAYRLQLPGGIGLDIRSGFQVEELATLMDLLRGL